MKLNKTFGRIATTLVATAMLASVAAVPAFAVETSDVTIPANGYVDQTENTDINSFSFKKVLEWPADVEKPQVQFNFELKGVNPVTGEIAEKEGKKANVVQGIGDTITANVIIGDAADGAVTENTYNEGENDEFKTKQVTDDVKVTISGINFLEPGVYKYELTEKEPTNANVSISDFTTSKIARTVYLYVERVNDNIVVTGVTLFDGQVTYDDEKDQLVVPGKTDSILNYYLLEGDPDNPDPDNPPSVKANEIAISKTVAGEMGNQTERFNFDVKITDYATGKTYNAVYETTNDGSTWTPDKTRPAVTFNADNDYQVAVQLAHHERLRITGFSNGEKCTVDEADYSTTEGYTTSVAGGAITADGDTATFSGSNLTIDYTNTRNAVSPTGLIMDIAPYVLLVVVAAAGCFVFLRKRRED